jgi:hypothetical protein
VQAASAYGAQSPRGHDPYTPRIAAIGRLFVYLKVCYCDGRRGWLAPYDGDGILLAGSQYMPMPILTLTHGIPIWFLVLSLFLPRISLFIGWIHMWWFFVPQPWAAVLWAFLPRVLVLIFIHAHQGFDLWFWIHLVTAIVVWSGSGVSHNNRRMRRRRT